MDRTLFGNDRTGRLVTLDERAEQYAFVPDALPANWKFEEELWPLLAEAKETLGKLSGIGLILPDPLLLLTPLQTRESISSSSIEGTFVTPEQLLLFEMESAESDSMDEKRADWREVSNYGRALTLGSQMIADNPVTHHLVRGMHSVLMSGVRGMEKGPGEYRSRQVQIGTEARFVPPPASEVATLMDNLIEEANRRRGTNFDPLISAFIVHYQFEAIHPFLDGNGRVGRLLLSLMIYKNLGHTHPWLYLSPFFEEHKQEYIERMFRISTNGEWKEWIRFCLRGTIAQSNDAIERCQKFRALKEDYLSRIAAGAHRVQLVVDWLFQAPVITIPTAASRLNVTYPTAKSDIEKLVELGILTEHSGSHPKVFLASEILKIAYR